MPSPCFESNSTSIATSVFVKVDPGASGSNRIIQCTGSDLPIAITQEYSKYAPVAGASALAADAVGDPVKVYGLSEVCHLLATTAGWTAGDTLGSNASGLGITVSSGFYGAVALTTMAGAGLGRVQVVIGKK